MFTKKCIHLLSAEQCSCYICKIDFVIPILQMKKPELQGLGSALLKATGAG